MKKTVRRISSFLHLWLGLLTGGVVFVIALTGCLWVFQEEITRIVEGERIVELKDLPFITPTEARDAALDVFPGHTIHGTIYRAKTDPVEVVFYEAEPEFYQSVYLDPYNAHVLEVKDHRSGFFWFILKGHLYLWLPKEIGIQITRYGTLLFLLLLLTGIILWWPKSKSTVAKKVSFKWKGTTQWRRKNYDLHSILGFYASVLAFLIAFTGLIMAFGWVSLLTYRALGGEKTVEFVIPENISTPDKTTEGSGAPPIDRILPELMENRPDYEYIEIHYPEHEASSILVEISTKEGVYYDTDYRFYDQYSMQELQTPSLYGSLDDAGFAEKTMRMYYDVHVGAIGGLPGKAIAFTISLITASLPVTGFIFWIGRKRKQHRLKDIPHVMDG